MEHQLTCDIQRWPDALCTCDALMGPLCLHGVLKRKCELCECDAEIERLRADLAACRKARREALRLYYATLARLEGE